MLLSFIVGILYNFWFISLYINIILQRNLKGKKMHCDLNHSAF